MTVSLNTESSKPIIGFVGQGYVGKNYADDFSRRGFKIIRYAKEKPHHGNGKLIRECDVVFIAVPTPTNPKGFDDSVVRGVLRLVSKGKIVVIKSTVLPGTTKKIQKENPKIIILNSPEFLSERTATEDAASPFSNIIGMPVADTVHKKAAELILRLLPKAPFSLICGSTEAEIIKYAHNGSGYTQIIFFNAMYDLARNLGADWSVIERAILADPLISRRYARPVHKSGRGAGGNCFVKDFAALSRFYRKIVKDPLGAVVFVALEKKNIGLLLSSGKDVSIVKSVYGPVRNFLSRKSRQAL